MRPDPQPAGRSLKSAKRMYKEDKFSAHVGGTLKAAQNLARHLCYRSVEQPELLPFELRSGLNIHSENLILLPSTGAHPYRIEQAVRETRASVLIIERGSNECGEPTFYFTLLRCAGGQARWHRSLRLWIAENGKAYLIPDPSSEDDNTSCFALDRGVRPAGIPWCHSDDRLFGLRQGDVILLSP